MFDTLHVRGYLLDIATELEYAATSLSVLPYTEDEECRREHVKCLNKAIGIFSIHFLSSDDWLLENGFFTALAVRQTGIFDELRLNASGYGMTLEDWVTRGQWGLMMCSLFPEANQSEQCNESANQVVYETFLAIVGYVDDLIDIDHPEKVKDGAADE